MDARNEKVDEVALFATSFQADRMITNRTTKLPKRKQLFVLVPSVSLVWTSLPHQEFGYLAGKRAPWQNT
jgi:hypothetical protein